jgi:hypothetical protein
MSGPQNNHYENSQKRIEKRRMEEIKKKRC